MCLSYGNTVTGYYKLLLYYFVLIFQDALDLQLYVANKVQSCLRSERNQQVMCQAGLPQQMLLHCQAALEIEEHPLHLPLQRIFERLATQALTPVVLRYVLLSVVNTK